MKTEHTYRCLSCGMLTETGLPTKPCSQCQGTLWERLPETETTIDALARRLNILEAAMRQRTDANETLRERHWLKTCQDMRERHAKEIEDRLAIEAKQAEEIERLKATAKFWKDKADQNQNPWRKRYEDHYDAARKDADAHRNALSALAGDAQRLELENKELKARLALREPGDKNEIERLQKADSINKNEIEALNNTIAHLESKLIDQIYQNEFLGRQVQKEAKRANELQQLREGDFKLTLALARDVGIPILAPDNCPGTQWCEFHDGVMGMKDQLKYALQALELCMDFARNIADGKVSNPVNYSTLVVAKLTRFLETFPNLKTETKQP